MSVRNEYEKNQRIEDFIKGFLFNFNYHQLRIIEQNVTSNRISIFSKQSKIIVDKILKLVEVSYSFQFYNLL